MCQKILKKLVTGTVLAVALMAGAQAEALTYDLSTEFSGGASPVGTPPWLTATFTQMGANTVRLTMADTNLSANEFVDQWLFNYDPTKDATSLTFTYVSGILATVSTVADNSSGIAGDGGGRYDIQFNFPAGPPSARFGENDTSVYDITFTGLTEADFDFLSAPPAGNGQFHTAAHVQGIATAPGAPTSGWIGDENGNGGGGGGSVIPEPGTFLLLGAGLMGLGLYGRKRIKK